MIAQQRVFTRMADTSMTVMHAVGSLNVAGVPRASAGWPACQFTSAPRHCPLRERLRIGARRRGVNAVRPRRLPLSAPGTRWQSNALGERALSPCHPCASTNTQSQALAVKDGDEPVAIQVSVRARHSAGAQRSFARRASPWEPLWEPDRFDRLPLGRTVRDD
jgi:hypothetical protein